MTGYIKIAVEEVQHMPRLWFLKWHDQESAVGRSSTPNLVHTLGTAAPTHQQLDNTYSMVIHSPFDDPYYRLLINGWGQDPIRAHILNLGRVEPTLECYRDPGTCSVLAVVRACLHSKQDYLQVVLPRLFS